MTLHNGCKFAHKLSEGTIVTWFFKVLTCGGYQIKRDCTFDPQSKKVFICTYTSEASRCAHKIQLSHFRTVASLLICIICERHNNGTNVLKALESTPWGKKWLPRLRNLIGRQEILRLQQKRSLTSEFCRDSHIIIFILRFHFRMRKWQELSRWKRFFAPQSLWMDPRPRGHFSCLLLENILLMVLLPFFTPSSLQKDAVCWAAKTHCKNQLWQVLMEKSFDKWPPLIPDNMFHVMSTYPLFGVMVERKDGRGSAQIVFG